MLGKRQMSETYLVASILAVTGGYLDAYSYICRGGVFANAQTGNIVLLGISILEGKWLSCIKYLIPILMFVLGVLTAEIVRKYVGESTFHWRQHIVALEAFVLIVAAFLPNGAFDNVTNTLISFVCSLQVQSFRKVGTISFSTTMCTGNLRTASEDLFKYKDTKEVEFLKSSLKLFGIIGFFIIGVIFGTLISESTGNHGVLAPVFLLIIVFVLMFINND